MPLSAPVTAAALECASGRYGRVAVAGMQGWRSSYEDAYFADPEAGIFAVYDGHLGDTAAAFCAERLHLHVAASMGEDLASGMKLAFEACDAELRRNISGSDGGSTATLALVRSDKPVEKGLTVLVGNCGDCRAILWRKQSGAVETTWDSKPSDPEEKRRIEAAGGFVCDESQPARVDAELAISRAFGDFDYKSDPRLRPCEQKVSVVPDVYQWKVEIGDWLLIGCDGVFECMSNERIVEEVCKAADASDLEKILGRVLKMCMQNEAEDNLTLLAVELGVPGPSPERTLTISPGDFLRAKDAEVVQQYESFCMRFGYEIKKERIPRKAFPVTKLARVAHAVPGPQFAFLPPPRVPDHAALAQSHSCGTDGPAVQDEDGIGAVLAGLADPEESGNQANEEGSWWQWFMPCCFRLK